MSLRDFEASWPLKTSGSAPLPLVTVGQALRGVCALTVHGVGSLPRHNTQ